MRTKLTVLDSLLARAEEQPSRAAFGLAHRDNITAVLTFSMLLHKSLLASACLKRAGLQRGDRVIVCLPTGEELLWVLFGVLLAGGVVVPTYPLSAGQGLDRWKQQVRAIARVAQVRGVVVDAASRARMSAVLGAHREKVFILDPSQLCEGPPASPCPIEPDDLAFVQFTSGTTRDPRGVAISHSALAANVQAIVHALELGESTVSVSWLPPYHDMGLVGHVFAPIVCGAHQVLLPTSHFLLRPLCWLQLLSKLRANQTTAPNTGYSICAHRISADARSELDLSNLRQALVGAELVMPATLDAFAKAFRSVGFSRNAFRPVYGLAESTLAVAIAPRGGTKLDSVCRTSMTASGHAKPAESASTDALTFVSVGHALADHELRIVDDTGSPAPARYVGEIQVCGPSLMQSYFNDPMATRDAIDDGWLRTGDLGYLSDGKLFVTGRRKELIIKAGRNYTPAEIEAVCEDDPAIRRGRVVAFGVPDVQAGTEKIIVIAEVRDQADAGCSTLAQRLTAAVTERAGVRPDHVELVARGVLPKTSSGKLQRVRVKATWLRDGKLAHSGTSRLLDNSIAELVRDRALVFAELGWSKARTWLNWR